MTSVRAERSPVIIVIIAIKRRVAPTVNYGRARFPGMFRRLSRETNPPPASTHCLHERKRCSLVAPNPYLSSLSLSFSLFCACTQRTTLLMARYKYKTFDTHIYIYIQVRLYMNIYIHTSIWPRRPRCFDARQFMPARRRTTLRRTRQ